MLRADLAYWGKVRFSGPDVRKFLNGLVTNDVLALAPGRALPCCVLTPKGKLLADFLLLDRGEDLLALCWPALDNLKKALGAKIMLSQSRMEDVSGSFGLLYTTGDGLGAGPVAPWELRRLDWGGHELWVLGYERLGPGGRLVLFPIEAGPVLPGAKAMDEGEWEALRVRAGVPLYGKDMDQDTIPLEARLEDFISFTKGCYMGQETVSRVKNLGHVNRLLVGLRFKEGAPSPGPVLKDGKEVGRATSVSPPLGLAMVRVSESAPGTLLRVGDCEAEVVSLPCR